MDGLEKTTISDFEDFLLSVVWKAQKRGADRERKRIVEEVRTMPEQEEGYWCFHTLDKIADRIESE